MGSIAARVLQRIRAVRIPHHPVPDGITRILGSRNRPGRGER
jgi:hypothetical protein